MPKKIYIASDITGTPIGVLLSDTKEKADLSWAAMGLAVYSVEEIDPSDDDLGMHGVVFLLTTEEHNSRDYSHRTDGVDFHVWKRER